MTRKLALSTMKSPFMPVPEVGGVLYLRAATSKLPWKAKMPTLMVGTDGHPGNIGSDKLAGPYRALRRARPIETASGAARNGG